MATIRAGGDTSVVKIRKFLGLNENPDGDTVLKPGEMAEQTNFRVTHDNHLQIRPGTKTILSLSEALSVAGGDVSTARLCGVWRGTVGAGEHILVAYGGTIWDVDPVAGTAVTRGTLTQDETAFFGFGGKVYALNGHEYLGWDGLEDGFRTVAGYVPLIQTATAPEGDGTLLENVNRLTSKRRVRFSPDGTAKTFQLPEKDLAEVTEVTLNGTAITAYAADLDAGTVTTTEIPEEGVNTLEVTYAKGVAARGDVEGMRFSELFNGSTDTRVFLYGDGTNRAIYSGIPFDTGKPSAEYFPDLYEVAVGEGNTPLTALVRHYSRLMAYKSSSAWVIQYGSMTLEDGNVTATFYTQPVNRQLGNDAPGQVKLVENHPLTLDSCSVYQWKSNSAYSGYISSNENNAKRISDRVTTSLSQMDVRAVKTFNVKQDHEYWFLAGGTALILNYANDTWYRYEGLPFDCLVEAEQEKYGFCSDGRVVRIAREYRNDDGNEISCYAVTGAMDFDRDWLLKYSPMIFVAMQPESNARVYVTAQTNRRADYPEKAVEYNLATLRHVDFNHFAFQTNTRPQVERLKLKVKKATFYSLVFRSNSASATATIIEIDVKLRYAGSVK